MYSAPSRRSTTPSSTLRGGTPVSSSSSTTANNSSSVGAPSRRLDTAATQPMSPHRSIQAAWKAGTTMEGVQVPASPSYGKKLEEESKRASSPSNTSYINNPMYARPLSSQTAAPVSRMSIDPFAKATGRSAISTAPSSPGTSRPSSAPGGGRPTTSASSAFGATSQPLPPHLSHLYFPSQTFPPFLLHIASRVFFAKMRDLNITTANLEKERRFVWLVCRQSMGAGLNSHVNTSTAAAVSTGSAVSSPLTSPTNKNANMVEAGYMSLRIPDASLGVHALREICNFLAYDTRFAHLQLSGNTLGDDGASLLAQMLARNSNLTSLDLRATGLGQGAFSMLLDSLIEHPSVTALDASSLKSEGRMFMGLKGAKSLSKVLRKNTLLRKLHLSNTGIVAESIGPIVKGLTFNRNLTSLDLSQNELSQRHMAKFGEAFASCFTLQALYLSENNIGTIGAVILGESLRKMENLKKLDLRRNNIGLKGLSLMTDVIGDMISLQELYLDGNNFNENNRGTSVMTLGNGSNSSAAQSMNDALLREDFKHRDYVDNILKRLHIMDKRISPRLLLNSALHTFSLDNTQIGDKLMEDLAKILSNHKGLQSLHVSHNNLTDLGGRSISELIKHSTSLQNVHVDSNGIADAGGSLICLALCTPSSAVNYLSMKVNNVGKNTATALLAALARKKSLHVDLTGNKIPWVLYSKLLELSSKNKRVFEASLSERYQAEWEKLHQRHEYRLSVEEEVIGSIDELKELQEELAQIESTHVSFMEAEEAETKRMQADLHEWNHKLHETRDIESRAEHDMNNHIKDLDGKVMALRKGIEKEQRFIISAEKLIPQTVEDTEKANKETDSLTADVRRDLRLYTTDRNVEYDSCLSLKADLMRFLRELESKIKKPAKSGSNKKSSTPNSPSASTKRPASSKGKRSSTGVPKSPSNAAPPAAQGAPTARPGTSSGKSRGSASPPRSKQSTRPPSAASRAESSLANNASSTSIGSSAAAKQKAAAAAAAAANAAAPATPKARAATAPLKKRVGTAKKKKVAAVEDENDAIQKLLMKDSPEAIAAQLSTAAVADPVNTTLSPEIRPPSSEEVAL